ASQATPEPPPVQQSAAGPVPAAHTPAAARSAPPPREFDGRTAEHTHPAPSHMNGAAGQTTEDILAAARQRVGAVRNPPPPAQPAPASAPMAHPEAESRPRAPEGAQPPMQPGYQDGYPTGGPQRAAAAPDQVAIEDQPETGDAALANAGV